MCLRPTRYAVAQCQHTMEARRATHHFSLFNPLRGAQKRRLTKKKGGGGEERQAVKGGAVNYSALLQAGLNKTGYIQIYTLPGRLNVATL